jgi:hypothetical protein
MEKHSINHNTANDGNMLLSAAFSDDYLQQMMSDSYKEVEQEITRIEKEKKSWKKKLKGLINVTGLFRYLEEMDGWYPYGFVEVYDTDEKRGGYKSYQHVRIKDDKDNLLYMKQPESEIKGIDHCCVWQTVGHLGDDYSGYLLYPLKNGLYFKVGYSC